MIYRLAGTGNRTKFQGKPENAFMELKTLGGPYRDRTCDLGIKSLTSAQFFGFHWLSKTADNCLHTAGLRVL